MFLSLHKFAFALWFLVMALIPLTAGAQNIEGDFTSPLRFKDAALDEFIEAPGIASDIRTSVSGVTARTHVVQYFFNPTDHWLEGVYTYPLPENAAVDKLVLMINDRRVLGFVAEKQKAQEIYEKAKAEGKAAGLVEQRRPNMFKTSVANVPPGALIAIEIAYQHEARIVGDTVSLRLPLAITPRYDHFDIKDYMTLVSANANGGVGVSRDLADRIALMGFEDGHNPVHLSFEIAPGFAASAFKSASDNIRWHKSGKDHFTIEPVQDVLPGSRDFTLEWKLPASDAPVSFMNAETIEGESYAHLVLVPPAQEQPQENPALRRQITFIIDTSGSMSGPSIEQAKSALREAVYDLTPRDEFNVIRFASDMSVLFSETKEASPERVREALRWIDRLDADGGTDMKPALQTALAEVQKEGFLRQIVFITDGAIGYEESLAAYLRESIGKARLYTVGIGSAPNAHLMTLLAETGRGTYTFIADIKDTSARMQALFHQMKSPVITDLALALEDESGRVIRDAEIVPARLPDLMTGEALSVAIKAPRMPVKAVLTGRKDNDPWRMDVAVDPRPAEGVGKIYARKKIGTISVIDPGLSDPANKAAVLDLGLTHQIASAQTSFVAVDEEILRPKNAMMLSKRYDPNLPDGWQLAQYDPREMAKAYDEILRKQAEDKALHGDTRPLNLPETADGYMVRLIFGFALLALGLGMLMYERCRYGHKYGF